MAKDNSFNGEILHCNAVRARVNGNGELFLKLKSLDEILEADVPSIDMLVSTYKEPTQLANFQSQRILLELFTTEIDEYFIISKLVIFVKPIYAEYPR